MKIVKEYKSSEISRLYEIECACFPPKMRWKQEAFPKILEKYEVWVARDSDKITGFMAVKNGYIATLEVDPEYSNGGIATKLVQEVKKFNKKLRLHVAIDNNPAIGLYLKQEFKITRLIKDYYYKGKHALEMKYGS